jgi:hypothetical protein
MKSLKEWYMEFIPHPDEPNKKDTEDTRFYEWLERTDNKLFKKHIVRDRKSRLSKSKPKII